MAKIRWLALGVLCVVIFLVVGCPGGGGGGSDNDADGDNFTLDPSQPSSAFVEATNPTERQTLIDEFVDVLVLPQGECWDASTIVGGAQPTGIVSQWQFDADNLDNVSFRFVGFETHTGPVILRAIGRFDGLPTALVETWTGDAEAFAIIDDDEIAHVSINLGGGLSTVRYGMNRGMCL